MSAPALLTIENHVYMSTKAAADLWGLHPKTVSDYCKTNKIINKFKNGSLGWYIRIDEIKPLTQEEIRRILILTLQLKNNPSCEVDWALFNQNETVLDNIYNYLYRLGYILPFSIENKKKIPYEVILTQRGMELVTSLKKNKIQDFATTLTQWLPIMINIAQLYIQAKSIG